MAYEADGGELEAEVDADQSQTLEATIEIPMLDGEAPVVHAVRKQDQIELTASDTRSTVTGIYYAAVDDTAIMDLPEYQKYSKPITYAENTMYYFYAEDAAGNCSVPNRYKHGDSYKACAGAGKHSSASAAEAPS